jgi:hypothetical protein
LLKKVPYYELRNDDILNGNQSHLFISDVLRCVTFRSDKKGKIKPLSAHITIINKAIYPTTNACCRMPICKYIILQNLEDQPSNKLVLVNYRT